MNPSRLLINGRLVDGDEEMGVINPATGEAFARAPRASKRQLEEAISAASDAFRVWSVTSAEVRRQAMNRVADAIERNAGTLARLLTQEQGKPLKDANSEVLGLAFTFRYFSGLDLSPKVIVERDGRRAEIHRRPLGVTAAIVPWNFPLGLIGSKVPAALAAGNTVVLKPAATTPLATLRVGELINDLLPPGTVNIVTDANDLGGELTKHPLVRKIAFTGSTATGRKVMAGAAETLKRVTLELGGNDPGIVLEDVDPKSVAPTLFHSAFRNSGQVCVALKRLYVHDSIYEEMCEQLARLAEQAIVGDGLQESTQFGPLQNRMQYERVLSLIADARAHGTVLASGDCPSKGFFIRPTIVRDIQDGTRLVDEEQFGPVLPVIRYSDVEDALTRANASPYGLGGSIWSADVPRAHALAQRIEAGSVWINRHMGLLPSVGFGGAKQSGIGVEMGEEGLTEFTQIQVINSTC